jgi:hypothetical protein
MCPKNSSLYVIYVVMLFHSSSFFFLIFCSNLYIFFIQIDSTYFSFVNFTLN